jgi:hypothetical protein
MGTSLKPILFFSDTITIEPHTATYAKHVGTPISIRQFAGEQRVRLEQVEETQEYVVTRADGAFIQGAEAIHSRHNHGAHQCAYETS